MRRDVDPVKDLEGVLVAQRPVGRLAPGEADADDVLVLAEDLLEAYPDGQQLPDGQ